MGREIIYDAVSAGCIVFDENTRDEVMVIKGHPEYPDYCSFPKGLVENGVSMRDTAIEETRQETGYGVSPYLRYVGKLHYKRYIQGIETQKTVYLFHTTADKNQPRCERDGECDEIYWRRWVSALNMLTYDNDKELLFKAAYINYARLEEEV